MSDMGKYRGASLRWLFVISLVAVSAIPVHTWASAQQSSAPLWVVRSLSTDEYGVDAPKGLAFSADENAFMVFDGTSQVTLIAMAEEPAGTRAIAEVGADPLNTAFDNRTDSLFVFDRGRGELAKVRADGSSARFAVGRLNVTDPQGLTFDPANGRMFVLDASNAQILSVPGHATLGFDANQMQQISLQGLGKGTFKGVAYNPNNGHLYLSEITQKKLHEITQSGELVNTFDLAALEISNPSAMTFAPSVDNTDDPNIYDLFILDTTSSSQIVELSLQEPMALPPGTTLLPATLVNLIDTSNQSWNPSSPDPAGIDYWPATNRLVISDSEVDEMRPYWQGANVFLSTTSGNLTGTCSTTAFTGEPTGVAINPNNNHIFIAADYQDRLFEISLGPDGQYCTADDTFTNTSLVTAYGVTDAEDVAYGNNTVFIAGGADAEVFVIPLGANGVVGGGDDGPMTHWDTTALGFGDLEGIGFNHNAGTLFIVSTSRSDKYLGETTPSGTLLRAYDLSFMPDEGNIRSDVTYAPGSQNPSIKTIYIASRGVDNDDNRYENDGKVWEISISNVIVPTPTPVPPVSANVQANIGGNNVGNYQIPRLGSQRINIPGINGGPVEFVSTNGFSILPAMRTIWQEPGFRSSYSELMGLPKEELSTEYWFPWYNNATPSMDQGFRIANVNATGTNTIEIWVRNTRLDSFGLGIGASTRVSYAIDNGPIRIVCTTCTSGEKILAAMRVIWREPGYRSSYSELMGLPKEQLSTEYWFPWYNNATPSMDQGFRIANVDNTSSHTIQVRVGTTQLDSFTLGAGASIRKSYVVNNGPIRILCTDCGSGGKILAAMRVIWQERGFRSSYSELMGLPKEQLSTEYWFPWYNNATPSMDQGFRIANVDSIAHTVKVFVGATQVSPDIHLAAGGSTRVAYVVNNGPVRIVCTDCGSGGKIIAAMRVIWQEPGYRISYSELMGLPVGELSTEYWFPWYNSAATNSMDQGFRIAVP
jgi:hypothetical protein